jgi:hypothetical protein
MAWQSYKCNLTNIGIGIHKTGEQIRRWVMIWNPSFNTNSLGLSTRVIEGNSSEWCHLESSQAQSVISTHTFAIWLVGNALIFMRYIQKSIAHLTSILPCGVSSELQRYAAKQPVFISASRS